MREEWLFSARRAWQNPLLKWATVATVAVLFVSTTVFIWRLFVATDGRPETFVLHYNIYFGADSVRSGGWILLLPAVWFMMTASDLLLGYGFYRRDPQLGASLIMLAFVWGWPWVGALFYLALMNL